MNGAFGEPMIAAAMLPGQYNVTPDGEQQPIPVHHGCARGAATATMSHPVKWAADKRLFTHLVRLTQTRE